MNIFDFSDYRAYVANWVQTMPKNGHGQYRKIAQFLGINSVNVTQIFRGDRDLTLEQACLFAEYLGLSELESQYFVALVELERAGHYKLKSMIQKRMNEIKIKSQNLKTRLKSQNEFADEAKAIFYSSWIYSGIRILTSLKSYNSPEAIAEYFSMPLSNVKSALNFLTQYGLCKEKKGLYSVGLQNTHIEASSPLVISHHINWRVKAIERYPQMNADDLSLSMPCSLSSKARLEIRSELVSIIEQITKRIDAGPEEELACLNIDWFKF